jgi:tRNA dimethylallyltransferase
MLVRGLHASSALFSLLALSMVCAVACRRSLRSMIKLTGARDAARLRPVILIAGPTGVGKSDVAMRLAARLGGEIISVDSVQVYRSLDIGSNKPSADERASVRHHLVDIRGPQEPYTAGDFYRDVSAAIAEVQARGRWPICVGGTSMYMHWLVSGTPTAPKADPALAAAVEAELAPLRDASDWDSAIGLLRELDGERAEALSRNDWYRLMRAVTIARQTSTPVAELVRADGCAQLHERYELRPFFLHASREQLARRINTRCERMLADGLLRETADLLASGELTADSQPARSVGYRQALEYLQRPDAHERDAHAFSAFVQAFSQASRAYAAAQMKWFRKETAFEWIEVPSPDSLAEVVTQIERVCALSESEALARRESAAFAQAQELAHRRNLEQGKFMKLFISTFPSLSDPAVAERLIGEADGCCRRLRSDTEPHAASVAR